MKFITFTDTHIYDELSAKYVVSLLERAINKHQPDLIVGLGDTFDNQEACRLYAPLLNNMLNDLSINKLLIYGNHDGGTSHGEAIAGWKLFNDTFGLAQRTEAIKGQHFVMLGDMQGDSDWQNFALNNTQPGSIVLSHAPLKQEFIDQLASLGARAAFSGHVHCYHTQQSTNKKMIQYNLPPLTFGGLCSEHPGVGVVNADNNNIQLKLDTYPMPTLSSNKNIYQESLSTPSPTMTSHQTSEEPSPITSRQKSSPMTSRQIPEVSSPMTSCHWNERLSPTTLEPLTDLHFPGKPDEWLTTPPLKINNREWIGDFHHLQYRIDDKVTWDNSYALGIFGCLYNQLIKENDIEYLIIGGTWLKTKNNKELRSLIVINANMGKEYYRVKVVGVSCAPTYQNGIIYIVGQWREIIAIQLATGKELWRKRSQVETDHTKDLSWKDSRIGGGWSITPAAVESHVWTINSRGDLFGYDPISGEEKFTYPAAIPLNSNRAAPYSVTLSCTPPHWTKEIINNITYFTINGIRVNDTTGTISSK